MKIIAIVIILLIIIYASINLHAEWSPQQKQFVAGTVPEPLPNGFYKGDAPVKGSWLGKTFDAASHTGKNIFKNTDGTTREAYPFKTYQGKGIRDTQISVMKIDYDVPENPFYVRPILDEVTEVSPGHLVGKLNYRLPLGLVLSIGFFTQEK